MGKKYFLLLFSVFIALFLVACSDSNDTAANENENEEANTNDENDGESIEITAAHVVSTDATQQDMYEKFKELVEDKSDGRITVEIYPDGQLGGEREMVESTQAGDIQISSPSVGVLENFSDALEVYDFPFIFEDRESVYDVMDGDIGKELLDDLEESGLKGLGYSENGWRHLTNNQGEIVKPEDVEGLKLRTMEVPMHMKFWEDLGANPTPLEFTEVFTGLQQGVVDGQENPLQLTYTSKFHEPAPYITLTGHIFDPEIVIANQDFMDGLSEADQDIINDSLDEAIGYLRELNADLDDELKEKLEEDGAEIRELSDEEHEAWVEATLPFYEKYADEVDKEQLKKVLETAGNEKALEAIE